MTKAELIRKIAKNVGVPDTDSKIFFELFLKKISAVVEIGQSIFVDDFGYFHLIKGSIKKPVFSFKDDEVSEEEVELVLYSEEKDLRNSETKGLVFNIPIFDEEDYHPIDSSFSLSIGKPLIPLRGVPFDNLYIPTSGYEYRRLIESKVEKLITTSKIAESVENFPVLVIDARSYNTNLVKLKWDDTEISNITDESTTDSDIETKTVASEYEKQTTELKNIAWDFGEDLSNQIEAESILDITDERINLELMEKKNEKKLKLERESVEQEAINDKAIDNKALASGVNKIDLENVEEDSSKKLDSLLAADDKIPDTPEEIVIEIKDDFIDKLDESIAEDFPNDIIEAAKPELTETDLLENEPSDKEFWESTSKYFETYKPINNRTDEEQTHAEFEDKNGEAVKSDELAEDLSKEMLSDKTDIPEQFDNADIFDEEDDNQSEEDSIFLENEEQEDEDEETEKIEAGFKNKDEYFNPKKERNFLPLIVFVLIIIAASLAFYWYLEIYKKNNVAVKPKMVSLKSDNAKIIERNFDIPVSIPYLPKVSGTTISETITSKSEEQTTPTEIITDKIVEGKNTETKKVATDNKKSTNLDLKTPIKNTTPSGVGLNVGNNIFKYGNYYVVQVASFRASSISENEAGKYRNKGYKAFVEIAEIPNRGKWYRVRVGNFSSKEEAQRFVDKNIR